MLTLWIATAAMGQTVTGGDVPPLNAQRFRPTIDGQRTLWVDDARPLEEADQELTGRLLFSYTDDPLVYENDAGDEFGLVTGVTQTDLIGGYTYGPARLGIDVPIYLLSTSNQVNNQTGLGDVNLDGRVIVPRDLIPLDLGANLRVALPTSTVDNALGSPNTAWELAAIVSKDFGPVLLAANVGTNGGPAVELENIELNDSFIFRTAAGYAITDDTGAAIEITGNLPYSAPLSNFAGWPMEWMLSGYGFPDQNIAVRGGFGGGMTSGIGAPDFRIVVGIGYEPRPDPEPVDTDMDGLVDELDDCPLEPEDPDSFEDEDGCPDPDNDQDGILDVDDGCPMDPEDIDEWEDVDGCPDLETTITVTVTNAETEEVVEVAKTQVAGGEIRRVGSSPLTLNVPAGRYTASATAPTYVSAEEDLDVPNGPPQTYTIALEPKKEAKVTITRERIELKDTINFETNKAVIKPDSFGLLDQAVEILVDYPEIRQMRIEGHTDQRGSDSYNQQLSEKRAASVLTYFVEHGVDAERLNSIGYGESKPLDPANNAEAWAKNRRVDFFIEEWDEDAAMEGAEDEEAPEEEGAEESEEEESEEESAEESEDEDDEEEE